MSLKVLPLPPKKKKKKMGTTVGRWVTFIPFWNFINCSAKKFDQVMSFDMPSNCPMDHRKSD